MPEPDQPSSSRGRARPSPDRAWTIAYPDDLPITARKDEILAALRAHPRRLRGTVILKPTVDRYTLEAMSRDGVVGVRLPYISLPQLPDLASFEYRSFLRRLADLDWHVHPHIEGERLPMVLPALEASGVKIVIDHLGRPEPRQGVNGEGFKAKLWERADANSDGVVDQAEALKVADARFTKLDANGDGAVERSELKGGHHGHGKKHDCHGDHGDHGDKGAKTEKSAKPSTNHT